MFTTNFYETDVSSAFSEKLKLKQHIETVHQGIKPYQCHMCDSKFYYPSVMKAHISRIHEGKKPEKINCSTCGKLFAAKRSLKDHIAVVHDGIKPFKCDLCDTSCAKQSTLKRQIHTFHEKQESI